MPIYAYRCTSCGHAQDVLQKISDPLLTVCPACGAAAYEKQVTAAGFQLKGSGWYVTDFRGGNSGAAKDVKKDDESKPAEGAAAPAAEPKSAESKPAEAASPAPAPAPAPAPPASGSGSGST